MINRYNSRKDSLKESFLKKNLQEALKYNRIAGYFSSSFFTSNRKIIESIEGKIRVVCNPDLNPRDVSIANRVKFNDSSKLEDSEDFFYRLLLDGKLEIRVIPSKVYGFIHGKAGVITKKNGLKISFWGSVNESYNAWGNNYEMVIEDDSYESIIWVEEEFNILWNNEHAISLIDFQVEDIETTEEYKEKFNNFIENITKNPNTIDILDSNGLWNHQKYFINKIIKEHNRHHNARYILADEVGLGKTLQLAVSAKIMAIDSNKPILIIAPKSLLRQWQAELFDMLNLPTAIWEGNYWVDVDMKKYGDGLSSNIKRCPFKVGIISQGLITSKSNKINHLLELSYECIIVDEAHHARRKNSSTQSISRFKKNNLYRTLLRFSEITKSMLLATATPIQISELDLWDLMNILAKGSEEVLGDKHSLWRKKDVVKEGFGLITSKVDYPSKGKWSWIKNPIPFSREGTTFKLIRKLEGVPSEEIKVRKTYSELSNSSQQEIKFLNDYFTSYNPFIRHIIRRERGFLEDKGLLEKIEVSSEEITLNMLDSMNEAYELAREFSKSLGKRTNYSGGFIRTLLFRRIGSSINSGYMTGSKILNNWTSETAHEVASEEEQDIKTRELKNLTVREREILSDYIRVLKNEPFEDPKLKWIKEMLNNNFFRDEGVILFSQYFDTADYMAKSISEEFISLKIGLYTGSKSGYYLNSEFYKVNRHEIKQMTKNNKIKILFGTDAASEGLNLQYLRRLVNIDLPWNPIRLEQRKGRIQRSGQIHSTIFLYNLRYKDTVEDKVHKILSTRLKRITEIFGQVPEVLSDAWIFIALEEEKKAKQLIREISEKHPFKLKYNKEYKIDELEWKNLIEPLKDPLNLKSLINRW